MGMEIKGPTSALRYENLRELPPGRTAGLSVRYQKCQEYLKNPWLPVT